MIEWAISPASPHDLEELVSLWEICKLTRPWNDPRRDFHLAVDGETSAVLVLRDTAEISGSIMVGFDGHRGWVYYLAVHPDSQLRGAGRALMTAAEDWLRAKSAPKIQLMVRYDNIAAQEFYAAIGYELQPVQTVGKRLDV